MTSPYSPGESPTASGAISADVTRPGNSIGEVLRAAESELQELIRQRADIVKRIVAIKRTIVGVSKLCVDEVLSESAQRMLQNNGGLRNPGLTDSCRRVLMEAPRPLSARAICAELEKRSCVLLSHHKDPVASVTTVLNRLANYGEACAVLEDGKRAWQWASEAQEMQFDGPAA